MIKNKEVQFENVNKPSSAEAIYVESLWFNLRVHLQVRVPFCHFVPRENGLQG